MTTILSQFDKNAKSDYIQKKAKDSIEDALKGYSDEVIEGAVATAKLSKAGADAVYSIAGFGEEAKATALRMTVLTDSEGKVIENTSGLATAFAGLKTIVSSFAVPLAVIGAIAGISALIDYTDATVDERIEKNKELAESYNESLSRINETESELSQVKSRMSELQNMGSLSFTDQEELERLRAQNRELNNRLIIERQLADMESAKLNTGVEDWYRKKFEERGFKTFDYKTGTSTFISNEDYLYRQMERFKELSLKNTLSDMETQEFDTLRRQLSETADQLIEQFDQYNPITNVQKELKAKAESMISDISFTLDPTTFKFDFISEKFNEIWDTDSFKDKKKALIDLAQAGELTPETLKSYEEFNDLLETGYVTLKDITSHIQSQYPIEEIIDPNAPKSVKDLTEQLGSLSSTGDLVTKALQEISETGGVSTSTFSALQSALPGVENAFERTANGIQFNTEKLRELTAAQTQTMADDLAKKYSALSKEYTEQSTLLAAYIYRQHENSDMTETQRSTLESLIAAQRMHLNETSKQLDELEMLGAAFDHATSKFTIFQEAMASPNSGANYDYISSSLEQIQKAFKNHDVGTDEFRAFVDYFTFEDMSLASIDDLVAAYDKAIEKAKRWNTEDDSGIWRFYDDFKRLSSVQISDDGAIVIENMEEAAKEAEIPVGTLVDYLNKLNEKGANIHFSYTNEEVVDSAQAVEALYSRLAELQELKINPGELDVTQIDKEIAEIEQKIASLGLTLSPHVDKTEAIAEIWSIQNELDNLSFGISEEDRQSMLARQKELAEKHDLDLDAVLNLDSSQAEDNLDATTEKVKTLAELINNAHNMVITVNDSEITTLKTEIENLTKGEYPITFKVRTPNVGLFPNLSSGSSDSDSSSRKGTAFVNGKDSTTDFGGEALVGELGPEIIVRGSRYFTVGENGAEFVNVHKDDIIFNHKQTEQLLENGKTKSRGKAYHQGKGRSFPIGTPTASGGKVSNSFINWSNNPENGITESKKKKNKKDLEDTIEKLDWIPRLIDEISKSYSDLLSLVDDSDKIFENQLNFLNAAIAKQKELIEARKQAEEVYKLEWETLSSTLSEEEKQLIMSGGFRIDTYETKDEDTKKHYDAISKADAAWKNYQTMYETRQDDEEALFENERKQYKKRIEWQKSEIEAIVDKSDIEQTSYKTQIDYLNQAMTKSKELTAQMEQYAAQANESWTAAKATIDAIDVAKIMNGTLNFADYTDLAYIEQLKEAIQAYEDVKDAEVMLNDQIRENAELAKQAFQKAIDLVEAQQEIVNGRISETEKTIELIKALGGVVFEDSYQDMIAENEDLINLYEEQIQLTKDRMSEVDSESAEYYELLASVQDLENALIDCKIQQAEWNEIIMRLPIDRLDKYISILRNIKQDLQNFVSEQNVIGLEPNEEAYQKMIELNADEINHLLKQQKQLEKVLGNYDYGSDKYNETASELQEIDNTISDLIQQQQEYNDAILQIPIKEIQKQVDALASAKTVLENRIAEDNALGLSTTVDQYEMLNKLTFQQIDTLKQQRDALTSVLGVYDKNSSKYAEVQDQINGINSEISSLIQNQYEWNQAMLQIPLDKMQSHVDGIASIKDSLQNSIDESNAKGLATTIDQYRELQRVTEIQLQTLTKQKESLSSLLSVYDKDSEQYAETEQQIKDIEDEISSLVQSQYEWNKEILNLPIEKLEGVNDNLNSYASILGEVIDEYESALSGVNSLLDDEIDKINDVIDATNEEYDAKIKPLEEQLELLQKTNEARSVELALEQAKYDLDRAKNQKTNKVIRDGEIVYEADMDAVRDANKAVADAEYDKAVHDLQTQIDNLTKERDELIEGYDKQIENLDEIKEKWSEIVEEIQKAADLQKAEELFGPGWQDKILSGKDADLLEKFKELYSSAFNEQTNVQNQIASNDRILDTMNKIIAGFQDGSMSYDDAVAGINSLISSMDGGFSALEQLGSHLNMDKILGIGDIASNSQAQITDSAKLLQEYLQLVQGNLNSTGKYETSWEDKKGDLNSEVAGFDSAFGSMADFIKKYKDQLAAIQGNSNSWKDTEDFVNGQIESADKHKVDMTDYLEAFKSNTEAISKNTKTWEEVRKSIEEQIAALKKAAEALEEQAQSHGFNTDGFTIKKTQNKDGDNTVGVYYRGKLAYTGDSSGKYWTPNGVEMTEEQKKQYWRAFKEDYWDGGNRAQNLLDMIDKGQKTEGVTNDQLNTGRKPWQDKGHSKFDPNDYDRDEYESDYDWGAANADKRPDGTPIIGDDSNHVGPGWDDDDWDKKKHHKGIELGFVGKKESPQALENFMRSISINPVKPGEVIEILQSGEGVFTENQMRNMAERFQLMSGIASGALGNSAVTNSRNNDVTVTFGDIHLHEVQNPDEFAKALDQTFATSLGQNFSKVFSK